MTPRDRGKSLNSEEVKKIRQDLDKQTPAQIARAEKIARSHAERAARDDGEKETFLGMLFGRKS